MDASVISVSRFQEIVKQIMLQEGLDVSNFQGQSECWLACVKEDIPSLQVVDSDEEWFEVDFPVGEKGHEEMLQPEWLSPICDEVVYGKGAASVSVYPHGAVQEGFVIRGSQQPGVVGYGVMYEDDEVCGLFPLVEGYDNLKHAYAQALRVRADGSLHLYLHEGLQLDVKKLRSFGLEKFDIFFPQGAVFDASVIRHASELDHLLQESILKVQYPYGYCYLDAVEVTQLAQAAMEFGSGPDPRMFGDALASGRVLPSRYLQRGEVSLQVKDGVAHLTRDLVGEAMSGLRELMECLGSVDARSLAGRESSGSSGFSLEDLLERSGRRLHSPSSVVSGMTGAEVYTLEKSAAALSDEKAYCAKCGFVVLVEGHESRCRPKRARPANEARDALVGDALHALDVKQLVAACCVDEKQMTITANRYIASFAQRKYLEVFHPGVCQEMHSDHTWGTVFEVMYHGAFRRDYVQWLSGELKFPSGVIAESVVGKLESSGENALVIAGFPVQKKDGGSGSSEFSANSCSNDVKFDFTCTSMRRVSSRLEEALPAIIECERRALDRLKSSSVKALSAGEEYRKLARSAEFSSYRRQCASLLERVVHGPVSRLVKVAGFRTSYVLRVLSGIMTWAGVSMAKLENVSVTSGCVKLVVGEYVVELPVPQTLWFSPADIHPKDCVMCGEAHWVTGDGSDAMVCCKLDKFGQEFASCYETLFRSELANTA